MRIKLCGSPFSKMPKLTAIGGDNRLFDRAKVSYRNSEMLEQINEIAAYSSKLSTDSGTSFESLSMEWLVAQKPQLKASSVAKYTNILTSYLIPRYGKMSVDSIARIEVVEHSRELLIAGGVKSNGLSPKTVNSILSVMKNIFAYAERLTIKSQA